MADDLDEALEPLLMDDGKRSRVFPADLRSLNSYGERDIETLMDDYDLDDEDTLEENIQSFMDFIGVRR